MDVPIPHEPTTQQVSISRDSLNEELRKLASAWRIVVSSDKGFEMLMNLHGHRLVNDPLCREINQLRAAFVDMQASGSTARAALLASNSAPAPSLSSSGPITAITKRVLSFLKYPVEKAQSNYPCHSTSPKTVELGPLFPVPHPKERPASHPRLKSLSTAKRIAVGKKHLSPRDKWVRSVAIKHGQLKVKGKVHPQHPGTQQPRPVAGPRQFALPNITTGPSRAQPVISGASAPDMPNMSANAKGKQCALDPEIEQVIPMAHPYNETTVGGPAEEQGEFSPAGPPRIPLSLSRGLANFSDNQTPIKARGQKRARDDDDVDESSRPRTRSRTRLAASSITASASPGPSLLGQENYPVASPQAQALNFSATAGPTNVDVDVANANGSELVPGPRAQQTALAVGSSRPRLRRESTIMDLTVTLPSEIAPSVTLTMDGSLVLTQLRRESTIMDLNATLPPESASSVTTNSDGSLTLPELPATRCQKRTRSSEDVGDASRSRPRRRSAGALAVVPPPPSTASSRPRTRSPRHPDRRRTVPGQLGRGGAPLLEELTPYALPPTPLRNFYTPPEVPDLPEVPQKEPSSVFSSVFQWLSPTAQRQSGN
ncbi:hypothetical protein GALMADRAFT_139872 [Galerina marginata CBS 339.88]|uniref:Uncharacterized protein n=1 Tax=Galerina marginata (strain CBS 339.88) TaxID=685588 RepID=A0A067T891_GALM3|nr:hypothetical protein GALMADRAFT_139872 [Galerina marginata CBS 339.88]